MNKVLFFTIILLGFKSNLFGQTAAAYASATIVNSVGAEISGEISYDFAAKRNEQISAGTTSNFYKIGDMAPSINIIGGSEADNVAIQNEPLILKSEN